MSRQRRNFSAKFKSDLVIELLKGEKDLNTRILTEIRTLKIQGQHIVEWPISWKNLCSRECRWMI